MDSPIAKPSSGQEPSGKSACDFFTPQRLKAIKEALDHKYVCEMYTAAKEEKAAEEQESNCIICKEPTFHKCLTCLGYYCWVDWKKHEGSCKSHPSEQRSFKPEDPNNGMMISKNSSPFSKLTQQVKRSPLGGSGSPYVKKTEKISSRFFSKFRTEEESRRIQERMLLLTDDESKSIEKVLYGENNKGKKFPLGSSSAETESGSNSFLPDKNKFMFKMPKKKSKNRDVVLANRETRTVIFIYQEPETQIHWVMEEEDMRDFELIHNTLAKECDDYDCIKPEVGVICGCKYSNEWCRARVVALFPVVRVHFIDYGNMSDVTDSPLKKLPPEIRMVKNLVYSVKFDESVPIKYKNKDLMGEKLKVEALRITSSGVDVIRVLPENSETEEDDTRKSVMNFIKSDSKGEISFLLGDSRTRYGLIIPKDCEEKIEADIKELKSLDSSKLNAFTAAEGDYVLVSHHDEIRRGKVISILCSTYYVLLIDYGIVIGTEGVGRFPEDRKDLIHLGVNVIMTEIWFFEKVKNAKKLLYQVTGEKNSKGMWPCDLKDTSSEEVVAKGYIQSPPKEGVTVPLYMPLESGSTCEMTVMTGVKSCYVRSQDEQAARKSLEMSVKMAEFLVKVDSLTRVPRIGKMYAANNKKNDCFYRVLVKSVKNKKCVVLFVDYGIVEKVCCRSLKPLPLSIKVVPFFAMEVTLSGITVEKLSYSAKMYLDKLIEKNSTLVLMYNEEESDEVVLEEKNSGLVVNEMIENPMDEMINVNKKEENDKKDHEGQNNQEGEKDKKDEKDLKDQKEEKNEAGEKDKKDEDVEKDQGDQKGEDVEKDQGDQNDETNKKDLKDEDNKAGEKIEKDKKDEDVEKDQGDQKDEEGDEGEKNEVNDEGNVNDNNDHGVRSPAEDDVVMKEELKLPSIKTNAKHDLVLQYIDEEEFFSSLTFWMAKVEDETVLQISNLVNSKIGKYCCEEQEPYGPREHEMCLALYEGDWYRALTISAEKDNYEIFFIDFGNTCMLKSKDIRKIKREFMEYPAWAFKCTISGIGRLIGKEGLKKEIYKTLKGRTNSIVKDVEVTKYEQDIYCVAIPEIEKMF